MTNEEINRYCHEVILGLCWHEGDFDCLKCSTVNYSGWPDNWNNPNHCSSLDAVAEVEAKVIAAVGLSAYLSQLMIIEQGATLGLCATALQRATACVKAWETDL